MEAEFIEIPRGWFLMGGSPYGLDSLDEAYGPLRQVFLDTYWIQDAPVTMRQWNTFLEESKYTWDVDLDLVRMVSPTDSHPVTLVSWYNGVAFCEWLTTESGQSYHLPTEAQWEKACRGTDGRRYPWGDEDKTDSNTLMDIFCKDVFFKGEPVYPAVPIRSFPHLRSAYGCYDMWLNVTEWCLDWFDDFEEGVVIISNPKGPSSGDLKIIRGGFPLLHKHCARRAGQIPTSRNVQTGFRVVTETPPA